MGGKKFNSALQAIKSYIHDLAAASNSRKDATITLLDTSISDSSFVIHSSKEHRLCTKNKVFKQLLKKKKKEAKTTIIMNVNVTAHAFVCECALVSFAHESVGTRMCVIRFKAVNQQQSGNRVCILMNLIEYKKKSGYSREPVLSPTPLITLASPIPRNACTEPHTTNNLPA